MEFYMDSFLIKLLILSSSLLVLNTCLCEWHGSHCLPDVSRLWDEEQDTDPEDPEQNCTYAKCPLIAKVLDDVSGDESSTADAAKQEEIPDCDAGSSLVDKVHIADRRLNKNLIRRHPERT